MRLEYRSVHVLPGLHWRGLLAAYVHATQRAGCFLFHIRVGMRARARVWLCVTSHVVAGRANRSVPVRRGLV